MNRCRGCAEVGESGQTVNLLFRLNRFESYHPHIELGKDAGVAQLVEHQPSKLRVAGSSLVFRSNLQRFFKPM